MKYTYIETKKIAKIQLKLARGEISLRNAQTQISKISSYPVLYLDQISKRINNCLKGVGKYGYAFPSNWAQALLELTNNDPLVIQAFRQQQALYLKKTGKNNQKLETLLNVIEGK